MNFYISDLHIGHANIISLDKRPFKDIDEMNRAIIENWNNRVKPEDTVYILGDFIWLKEEDWDFYVEQLTGKKVLIVGNHDPKQFSPATQKTFSEITPCKEIKDSGHHLTLCHYPIPFFRAGSAENSYMLYGHVHQKQDYEYLKEMRKSILANYTGYGTANGNFINVGAMMPYMNYTPRTLEEIIVGDKEYRQMSSKSNVDFKTQI